VGTEIRKERFRADRFGMAVFPRARRTIIPCLHSRSNSTLRAWGGTTGNVRQFGDRVHRLVMHRRWISR